MEGDPIHFKSAHADFLIRMSCSKFVPFMTMKIISKEYLGQSMNSLLEREKVLRSSLSALPIVTAAQVDDVVHDVIYEDKFILAQKELDTEHKFMKYVREAFKFIEPVEVILNKKEVKLGKPKECFHYVPIVKAFRNLIEDETMIKLLEARKHTSDRLESDVLRDIKDGTVYQGVPFFQVNPSAYVGILYSDAVEIVNPLGASRGKHKIIQLFWTLWLIFLVAIDQRSIDYN